MAGVTNPTIIKGMEKERNSPKSELKVTNKRAIPPGRNWPNRMPAAMAMTTLPSSEMCIFFMMLFDFVANSGHKYTH